MLVRYRGDLAPAGVRYTRVSPGRFLVGGRHVIVAGVTHGRLGMVGVVVGRAVVVVVMVRRKVHVLIALILEDNLIITFQF